MPGVGARVYNANTEEAKAGGCELKDSLRYSETLPQNN